MALVDDIPTPAPPRRPSAYNRFGDLNRRGERLLSRYQLNSDLGRSARTSRIARRLGRLGISDPSGTIASEGFDTRQLAEDALFRMAKSGAIGGKAAKRLNQDLTRKALLGEVEQWGSSSATEGIDEIGMQYGDLATSLRATLGDSVDTSSPAVQSILAGLQEGRQGDTRRFLTNLDIQKSAARSQITEGYGNMISETLDETGALMEALKQLREQESALAAAQRGSIYSSVLNPLRALGAGVGGAVGGRQGAASGGDAAFGSFAELLSMLQSISQMGGQKPGSGGGGPVFTP